MWATRIRAMRAPHWLALYAAVLLCWALLALLAVPPDLRGTARAFGGDVWSAFCTTTPDVMGFARMWIMWALMSGAMMAPTALPAFATYDDLPDGPDKRFGALALGYLSVWLGFAIAAAGVQLVLFRAGLVSAFGDSRSDWLSALLLLLAGLYQFSSLKAACLARCRLPLTFFLQHWADGALRMGLRLGAICLGCCWALMLLGFVGGVMSLGFMAVATVVMMLEKLQAGRWLTAPLGVFLIGSAFVPVLG